MSTATKQTLPEAPPKTILDFDVFQNPTDRVNVVGQMMIVSHLAKSHPSLQQAIDDEAMSLVAVLFKAQTILEQDEEYKEAQKQHFLVFPAVVSQLKSDPDWEHYWRSALKASITDEDLRASEEDAEHLLLFAQGTIPGFIGVPMEVFELMASPLKQMGAIGLPNMQSAFGLLSCCSKRPVDIRVKTEFELMLVGRCMYLGQRRGAVQLANESTDDEEHLCSEYLSVPVWNEQVEVEGPTLPKSIGSGKALRSDAMEVIRLVESGKPATVLVPSGLLHLSSHQGFRQWLIESGALSAVVELPSRLLSSTDISSVILELNRPLGYIDGGIMMIDSTPYITKDRTARYHLSDWETLAHDMRNDPNQPHARLVLPQELGDSNYELSPRRYLGSELDALRALIGNEESVALGDIVSIIRPTPLAQSKKNKGKVNSTVSNTIEVLISDIDHDGIVRTGSKTREVPTDLLSRIESFRLLPNDILISTKGTIGKVGLCKSEIPDNLYCGQTMAILRLDHSSYRATAFELTTEYLFRYLLTPQVSNYLRSCAGGSSIQFIKAKDLNDLPVPAANGVKQQRISDLHYTILDHYQQAETLSQEANKFFENTQ